MTSRTEVRAAIFSAENRKFKTEEVTFYGQKLEIRQPSLQQILDSSQTEDRKQAVIDIMVGYCYVPGTEEKVFEASDKDMLLSMPFGDDFLKINQTIEKLTSVNVLDQAKNSVGTPNAVTS
jgi:hypothetical protein